MTTVRAPIEEVLAIYWDTSARNQKKASTLYKEVLEERNNHNRVDYVVKKGTGTVLNRAFSNRLVWQKESSSSIFLVSIPQELESVANLPSPIRIISTQGKLTALFRLTAYLSSETNVESIFQLDFGGGLKVPKLLMEYFLLSNLKRVSDSQQYFQQLRELKDYDAKDGIAFGEVFMSKSMAEKEYKRGNKYQVGANNRLSS